MGGNPINFVDPYGLWAFGDPLPQSVVDFSAGFGDALSFGATDWVRDQMGTNGVVNKCSLSYAGGELAGEAVGSFSSGGTRLSLGVGRKVTKGVVGPAYRAADSAKLEKILTSYYGKVKSGNRVGNGGLADALRHEKITGELLSPSGYGQKAIDVRRRINKFIRNAENQPPGSNAYSQGDVDFARQLVMDLDDAINL